MASVALPAWVRPRHPIVFYETRHWLRSRVWRAVRYTLWGGTLTFLLVPAACAIVFSLQARFSSLSEAILTLGGTFTLGLVVISALAGWLNNLSASLLGATLIARERETHTWSFLRLTTLTTLDILGAKFMALLYTLAYPLHVVAGLRVLALLTGALTAGVAFAASGLTWDQVRLLFTGIALSPFELASLRVLGLVGLPLALVGWLAEPYFGAVYNGAVGLAASTLVRSRGSAIILTLAAHFVLGLGLYVPAQQIFALFLLGLMPDVTNAGLVFPALWVVLPTLLQVLLHVGVLAGALGLAWLRVERLSD